MSSLKFTVYKITNLVNGKTYIGKHATRDINDGYMGSGKLIKAAIRKHGIENFAKEILRECDSEDEMNRYGLQTATRTVKFLKTLLFQKDGAKVDSLGL